jgi:hypothetical protein
MLSINFVAKKRDTFILNGAHHSSVGVIYPCTERDFMSVWLIVSKLSLHSVQ